MKSKNNQTQKIPIDADAGTIARGLASSYLRYASLKSRQLLEGSDSLDSETLHNFRVALRHLRGILKSYKDAFPSVKKSNRATLQRVAKATNRARDLEVIIAWVDAKKGAFDAVDHGPLMRIIAQLKGAWIAEIQQLRHHKINLFRSFSHCLAVDLSKMRHSKYKSARESFRVATHAKLVKLTKRLQAQIECALHSSDPLLLHQTRVTIKRMRYLIEPLMGETGAKQLIEQLKNLQDIFGIIQDLQVLTAFLIESLAYAKKPEANLRQESEERRVGLKLLEMASKEQKKRVGALNQKWLKKNLFAILSEIEAFILRLESGHMEWQNEGTKSP